MQLMGNGIPLKLRWAKTRGNAVLWGSTNMLGGKDGNHLDWQSENGPTMLRSRPQLHFYHYQNAVIHTPIVMADEGYHSIVIT